MGLEEVSRHGESGCGTSEIASTRGKRLPYHLYFNIFHNMIYIYICLYLRVVYRILWPLCPHHLDEFLSVASLEQLHTGVGIRNHQLEWIPWPICIFLMYIPEYPDVEQGFLLRKCVSGWDRAPFDREWYNLLMLLPRKPLETNRQKDAKRSIRVQFYCLHSSLGFYGGSILKLMRYQICPGICEKKTNVG